MTLFTEDSDPEEEIILTSEENSQDNETGNNLSQINLYQDIPLTQLTNPKTEEAVIIIYFCMFV